MKTGAINSRAAGTLVILSPGFPASEADTTCLPPQQVFVNRLRKEYPALNIVVIAFQYPFVKADYTWKDIRVISLNGRNRRQPVRIIVWLNAWRMLKKIRKDHPLIGIFSFWCGECALIGKWFGKKYSIGHHCWILGQDARETNRYVKWIRPGGRELVALSDFVAREFYKNHGILPATVIPTGVDPDLFETAPMEKDIDILGVGSLIPLKNYELFLHSIHLCKKQLPGIRAVICGKGPEERRLKELIRAFRLEDHVQLAGGKEHPEALKLMQRSRILLHTSSYEGFGAVCIEALYAGAEVISFVKPMDAQIPGWHVVKSSHEMIRKMVELLQQPIISEPGLPFMAYSMNDTVKAVMGLFDHTKSGHAESEPCKSHHAQSGPGLVDHSETTTW